MTDDPTLTPAARGDDPDLRAAVREIRDGQRALTSALEQLRRERTEDQSSVRRAFATLAEDVERLTQPAAAEPQPAAFSWLDAAGTDRDLNAILTELREWLSVVYLRYHDARQDFPECWLRHPEVVEELLWLSDLWRAAYGPDAPIHARADWHDRLRPHVVERIHAYVWPCSLGEHRAGGPKAEAALDAPGGDDNTITTISNWWAHAHRQPAPPPNVAQPNGRDRR